MTAEEMWEAYRLVHPDLSDEVSSFQFGAEADLLADLVLKGGKTATASAYPLYAYFGEALPTTGSYDVVLDSQDRAICLIRTTKVYVCPFNQITEEHAFKEGEGDRSLAYWQEVHETFFRTGMAEVGLDFTEDMLVVCEEFEVVYPRNEEERE